MTATTWTRPPSCCATRSPAACGIPTYVDPSWIASTGINGGKVDLIPMMQSWVNTYYPGTMTGITEYNFGAEGNMNGATTQADLYGIFGQQGLNLATRWTTPATGSPTYLAMKLWRNYDGNDSGFGNTSVSASRGQPRPDRRLRRPPLHRRRLDGRGHQQEPLQLRATRRPRPRSRST